MVERLKPAVNARRRRLKRILKTNTKTRKEDRYEDANNSAVNMYSGYLGAGRTGRTGKSKSRRHRQPAQRADQSERFRRAAARRDKQCIGPGRFRLRANEFQGSRDPAAGWPAHERRVLCRM